VPHLGFDIRDYSTKVRVGSPPRDGLRVLVPRRDAGLPALSEAPDSSVRLRETRLFFATTRSASGLVVVTNVPPGTYGLHLRAPYYVPLDGTVVSPLASPLRLELHRDAAYPFAQADTLIRGRVVRATGVPLTGFDVVLNDPAGTVPHHRVPLNARGEFVIFAPEKRVSSTVTLDVFHPGGTLSVATPLIAVHRSTVVPLITVP
jgi:hypothetical protein